MVYHIPRFQFAMFDKTSEDALWCEIICYNWNPLVDFFLSQ